MALHLFIAAYLERALASGFPASPGTVRGALAMFHREIARDFRALVSRL